jgi:16S rRNA (guanine1207-N2)-methyltransferase
MIVQNISGIDLKFETDCKLFSYKSADKGTLFMLEKADIKSDDMILDIGCGYGLVGIYCAKKADPKNITMTDVDTVAVEYARRNLANNGITGVEVIESNAYENVERSGYTLILSNPPYHADFSVPKAFIEGGYRRLANGGRMYMVTKRLEWYKRKFISVFGGVRIFRCEDYYVFMGIRNKG